MGQRPISRPEADQSDGAQGLGELVIYRTEDGRDQIQLRLQEGSVWLTQAEIAGLFETTPQNITQHLRAIYGDDELSEGATCKQLLQVRTEGPRQIQRKTKLYNLKAILAVGYRVRSPRASGSSKPTASSTSTKGQCSKMPVASRMPTWKR